jgi:hypothetical protein
MIGREVTMASGGCSEYSMGGSVGGNRRVVSSTAALCLLPPSLRRCFYWLHGQHGGPILCSDISGRNCHVSKTSVPQLQCHPSAIQDKELPSARPASTSMATHLLLPLLAPSHPIEFRPSRLPPRQPDDSIGYDDRWERGEACSVFAFRREQHDPNSPWRSLLAHPQLLSSRRPLF